ncbi:MAG TPA: outer membrane lipoprotein carrier protein LolA [Kofleriaceae bacterium]|nr:outer membrane lipoprotein carrier protein LolA [Kofleriaceae bacterium]
MTRLAWLVAGVLAIAPARARADEPPVATLLAGPAAHGAALDPVLAKITFDRMQCKFSEEKHVALLAKPLRAAGAIVFDRARGVARITTAPKPSRVVLTAQALTITTGDHTEQIPLDKMRDLRAFALIVPTLFRGERAELERSFELALYGDARASWALAFVPRADALKKLVRRVVVRGHADALIGLQIVEASGDTTDTQLTEVVTNARVADREIATAFGAP